jgi:glycosyltransferase involved in cell wall biosynthesis
MVARVIISQKEARPPLRVLLAIDSLTTGGAERHVVDLAVALQQRGHEVAVAASAGGELQAPLDAVRIPVFVLCEQCVKRRVSPEYAAALRKLIARLRPDVVHAHLFASATAAAHATVGSGAALVVTEQTEAPWRGPRDRQASRFAYERAAHVIGVSSPICRELVEGFGVAPDRVSLVPNCVPIPTGEPTAPLPDARPLVGTVARLVAEKGLDTLLRAVGRVRRDVSGATFVIAGGGPLEAELRQLAAELDLDGVVRFLGPRSDGAAIIRRVDLLVVPSRHEGTPLVIAEALACGTPVVATVAGGIPDQIRDGREGLLVPVDDDEALADALRRVLTDDVLTARLRRGASERATTFDHDRMVDRLEAVLTAACGGGGRARAGAKAPGRSHTGEVARARPT